jgi:hypothetical protein
MCLRWTATDMLEAERQFRKIIGYTDLAVLALAGDAISLPGRRTRRFRSTVAAATVDRLLHHAHVLLTDGTESYRLAQATAGKGARPLT